MAFLSAIFTMLARNLGQLLRAVFGWSITGLFGKLPAKREMALTVALVLALLWPLLVVGIFVPAAASWAVAFVPLQNWISSNVLRAVWCVLAVTAPILVGTLARWAAPPEQKKGGTLRGVLAGFPLTVGFFLAFLLTLFVVPVLKLIAAVRRWTDEHVFVQVHRGHYRDVLAALVETCREAGVEVSIHAMPRAMALPTKIVNWCSRDVLRPLVPDEPKMLKGKDVELYLYPADLLIRGKDELAMRIRAAMTRSLMRAPAHLVQDARAQKLEDEIDRVWIAVDKHQAMGEPLGPMAARRVTELRDKLDGLAIPYNDWTMLYADLHHLERAVTGGPHLVDPVATVHHKEAPVPVTNPRPAASTEDLFKEAIDEAKVLMRAEIDLARDEIRGEVASAKTSGIALGAGAALGTVALAVLLVAGALAIHLSWLPVLIVGLVALVAGAIAFAVGYKSLPKNILAKTRERVESDVNIMKEQMA